MSYVNSASLMAMAVSLLNIATLLIMLRFVVRRLQKIGLGLDDWLIIPAWFLLVALCINVVVGCAYERLGLVLGPRLASDGFEAEFGTNDAAAQADQFAYVFQILSVPAVTFAKLSVLFFYRRMLCPENLGPFHQLTRVVVVATAVWGTLFTFLYTFQCGGQFDQIWNPTDMANQGICLGPRLDITCTVTDAIFDVIILILPIRKIMSLRLPNGKKFAIIGAFGVGGLTTAVSIIRCLQATNISIQGMDNEGDEGMAISIYIYWGLFEVGTAVIVACLPALQYLFRRVLPEHLKKSQNSGKGSGTQSTPSRLKSMDVLEKASVMTQSTMESRRPSIASTMPVFSSRPGTPLMDVLPPLPETPAGSFTGFHSRAATLTSDRPSVSSGTATPMSAGRSPLAGPNFHKRTPSSLKVDSPGFGSMMYSPVSRTSSMNSQTPLFEMKEH